MIFVCFVLFLLSVCWVSFWVGYCSSRLKNHWPLLFSPLSFWGSSYIYMLYYLRLSHNYWNSLYFKKLFFLLSMLSFYFNLNHFHKAVFKPMTFSSVMFNLLIKQFWISDIISFSSRSFIFEFFFFCCVSSHGHWNIWFRQLSSITGKTLKERVTRKFIINDSNDSDEWMNS